MGVGNDEVILVSIGKFSVRCSSIERLLRVAELVEDHIRQNQGCSVLNPFREFEIKTQEAEDTYIRWSIVRS